MLTSPQSRSCHACRLTSASCPVASTSTPTESARTG